MFTTDKPVLKFYSVGEKPKNPEPNNILSSSKTERYRGLVWDVGGLYELGGGGARC